MDNKTNNLKEYYQVLAAENLDAAKAKINLMIAELDLLKTDLLGLKNLNWNDDSLMNEVRKLVWELANNSTALEATRSRAIEFGRYK
jgi:hypothetical protein